MPHAISSETGTPLQRFMRLVKTDDGLMVQVRWRGLPESKDTLESLKKIHDDVPPLFEKLLKRKNTLASLAPKASHAPALEEGECNE